MSGKRISIRARRAVSGYLFILPFIIGFLCFMLLPLVDSFWMSLCRVDVTAGQGFQILDDLARRGHPDADAGGEHIALIFQHQAGFAAAEQLGKDAAKVFVDGAEAVGEDLPHLG